MIPWVRMVLRFLCASAALLYLGSQAVYAGESQRADFGFFMKLAPEVKKDEAIVISLDKLKRDGDSLVGPLESVVNLDLAASMLAAMSLDARKMEDLISRVEEWSEVTADFGKLDLEGFKSQEPVVKRTIKVGGRDVSIPGNEQSKLVFFLIKKVGGESLIGRKVTVAQTSCSLFPTVSTGDPRDKLACEATFEALVYDVAQASSCSWDAHDNVLHGATSFYIGKLSCGNAEPRYKNAVIRALQAAIGRPGVSRSGTDYFFACGIRGSLFSDCKLDAVFDGDGSPVGVEHAEDRNKIDAAARSAIRSATPSSFQSARATFSDSFTSLPLTESSELTVGLRKLKFVISPEARVSGMSYAGSIDINIKSL